MLHLLQNIHLKLISFLQCSEQSIRTKNKHFDVETIVLDPTKRTENEHE
jgi:hypothetical protein